MAEQGLLIKLNECTYPVEFLSARLLGRKGSLFRNWEFLIGSAADVEDSLQNTIFYPFLREHGTAGIWRFLRAEYLWVYRRMDNGLRRQFTSYFAYNEINTFFVCLRYLAGRKDRKRVTAVLYNSLLHANIKKILTGGQDLATQLTLLEKHFNSFSDTFNGLADLYQNKGMAVLEVFMRDRFFASVTALRQPAMLKIFFHYLVDMYNYLSLAKNMRWKSGAAPGLINGGTVPAARLQRAFFRGDLVPVLGHLNLKDPESVVSDVKKLETALLNYITGKLKSLSHQRTPIGVILFYLWEQYRYTRNISMILNTVSLDDESVRENIVG